MQVENIFISCLKDTVDNEIYNLIEPGKGCGKLAREVISKQQSEKTKELSKYIYIYLKDYIQLYLNFLCLLLVIEKKCTRRFIISQSIMPFLKSGRNINVLSVSVFEIFFVTPTSALLETDNISGT